MKKRIDSIIKKLTRKEQVEKVDLLDSRSAGVVENFNNQVKEIESINNEIRTEIDEITNKIKDLTETRIRLEKIHDQNVKTQNSIKSLIS